MSTETITDGQVAAAAAPALVTAAVAPAAAPAAAPAGPATETGEPDWLDGATEIELPSRRYLRAYWDADILDLDDRNKHDTILERRDPFEVRFRVYLKGRLWSCIGGDWCFDVGFAPIGDGRRFNLSDVVANPSELRINDWKGCQGRYVEKCFYVPGGTIPVEHCGTLYQVGAKFELRCCGDCEDRDSSLAVVGHEPQGEYLFV
jgi:hypothetical protein